MHLGTPGVDNHRNNNSKTKAMAMSRRQEIQRKHLQRNGINDLNARRVQMGSPAAWEVRLSMGYFLGSSGRICVRDCTPGISNLPLVALLPRLTAMRNQGDNHGYDFCCGHFCTLLLPPPLPPPPRLLLLLLLLLLLPLLLLPTYLPTYLITYLPT